MATKTFGDKEITIRKIMKSDFRNAKKFQTFINALVEEDAKLLINKKVTLKDEKMFLKTLLADTKRRNKVYLLAGHDNKIIGSTVIALNKLRRNHIGTFGITISKDYREMGLGSYLMSEIIKLAKKELNPKPKIVQLEVYSNNKPAISLYKKMGFKQVARLPKQFQYKGELIDELVMLLYFKGATEIAPSEKTREPYKANQHP
jgi:ribosomal protein S18 acetylase RimI-like enzyme